MSAYGLKNAAINLGENLKHKRVIYTMVAILVTTFMFYWSYRLAYGPLVDESTSHFEPTTTHEPDHHTSAPRRLTSRPITETPHSTIHTFGYYFATCNDYLHHGHYNTGVYRLRRQNDYDFKAKCEMDSTNQEAWMVIQQRSGKSVLFWNQTFNSYANGFGDPNGDHWLGLEHVQQLIRVGNKLRLRMEVKGDRCKRSPKTEYYVGEWNFVIGPRSDNYRLSISHISGNFTALLSDMGTYNSEKFNTIDSTSNTNCVKRAHIGGWWFKPDGCPFMALNGEYSCTNPSHGMFIYKRQGRSSHPDQSSYLYPRWSRMMIQTL